MFQRVYYTVEGRGGSGSIKFALATDLHRERYGEHQEGLMAALEDEKPDAVLMAGDIFHHREPWEGSEIFVRDAAQRFPCFYVTGNHENKSGITDELKQLLRAFGIRVLEGKCEVFEANGCRVNICGVDEHKIIGYPAMCEQLEQAEAAADKELFTILLSHRPELIDEYLKHRFDLILCGHAHGGQWRIPGLINGVYAPGQGFFPKYAGGRYDFEHATMIVGRGLVETGHAIPRIFNPPELVFITIHNA